MGLLFGNGVPWRAHRARKHYDEHRRIIVHRMEGKLADADEKTGERAAHVEV